MKISIKNFAQISNVDLDFGRKGDLTFIVGPQATGKSLALQWLKLVIDPLLIRNEFELYGFVWKNFDEFANLYFGEGLASGINNDTEIKYNNVIQNLNFLLDKRKYKEKSHIEKAYYIPAHRGLLLEIGRAHV